jgi:aminobenzoyl-glutamate transport protein
LEGLGAMSEQRRVVSIVETTPPKTFLQKMLDGVERVGNKVPHPAIIFFILAGLVILLSYLLHSLGTAVTYDVVNPQTHQVETATTTVNSLLSADGIRFMLTSMVRNFSNFGPVAIILVVMVGVGLAEQAGLMTALIKKIVQVTPRKAVTWILVTLGVLSSVASDAGYLVLIPLGAAAFLSLGRHPLAGLAAAFAGVAGVFGVNFLIVPLDGILTEITNDAIHLLNPAYSIALTANFYFAVVSSLVLIVVCALVTDRVVEPRLGEYQGEMSADSGGEVSPAEAKGSRFALRAGVERDYHRAVDVSGRRPAAGSADWRDHGQLAVYGQLDRTDHAGLSSRRDRLRRRREDDHEYDRRHQRRDQNLCRAQRPNFSAVCDQSIPRLF